MGSGSTRSRLAGLILCGAALVLLLASAKLASAQGSNNQDRVPGWSGAQRPGGGGRPGSSSGDFWPGAGPSNSGGASNSGEFWPGAGSNRPTTRPTTRRPSGPSGCSCPSTPEYNPVCGTDGVSYGNPGKLNCAKACGRNVSILHYGNCTPADPNAPSTSTAAPPSSTTPRRRSRT
ncbi:uncharacterized protein [Hetaerina americana]|uniref:uncharacterized protein n=1 Tax=Hetaerina americana TaxID=62018 RepID=UPI003A7F5C5F